MKIYFKNKILLFLSLGLLVTFTNTTPVFTSITDNVLYSRRVLSNASDVTNVNNLIDLIQDFNEVTYETQRNNIYSAYNAYNALSEEDKALVDGVKKEKLFTYYDTFIEYYSTDQVIDLIPMLPNQTKFNYANHLDYQDILAQLAVYYPTCDKTSLTTSYKTKYTSIKNKNTEYLLIDQIIIDIDNIEDINMDNYISQGEVIDEIYYRYLDVSLNNRKYVSNYDELLEKGVLVEKHEDAVEFINRASLLPGSDNYHRDEHNTYSQTIIDDKDYLDSLDDVELSIVGSELINSFNALYALDQSYVLMDDVANKLHMDENTPGQCINYYDAAKESYLNLSLEDIQVFINEYPDEFLRLRMWAEYHSDSVDNNGILTINPFKSFPLKYNDTSTMLITIVIVSFTIVMLLFVFAFITIKRRRPKNNDNNDNK